jgi:hypothetical protein
VCSLYYRMDGGFQVVKQGSIGPDWAQMGLFFLNTNIVVMIYSHLMPRYKHKIYVPKKKGS